MIECEPDPCRTASTQCRHNWFSRDMATIRDKLGHLETLPIDLLNAHLNASFVFNHLDAMNGRSKLLLCNRAAQKSWFITCSAWITCGDMARCRAAAKSRTGASLFSIIFRDLTASLRHLNPEILYLNPGRKFAIKFVRDLNAKKKHTNGRLRARLPGA